VGSRAIFSFIFLVPYSVTSLVQVCRIKRHFCFFFLIPLIVTNLIKVGRIESHSLQWDDFFFILGQYVPVGSRASIFGYVDYSEGAILKITNQYVPVGSRAIFDIFFGFFFKK